MQLYEHTAHPPRTGCCKRVNLILMSGAESQGIIVQLAECMQLAEYMAPAIVLIHAQPLVEREYEHVSKGV